MKTYTLPHSDIVVSRIVYGCFGLGLPRGTGTAGAGPAPTAEGQGVDIAHATRVVETVREHGINWFDLSNVYGFGRAEETLGEITRRWPGLRDDIVVQTKCGFRSPDTPAAGLGASTLPVSSYFVDLRRTGIVASAEGSLRRLRTDRLDVLLLHAPDALAEPDEVAAAFDDLHAAGKARCFGVSNHTAAQIDLLQRSVRQPLVTNQIRLGLPHLDAATAGIEVSGLHRVRLVLDRATELVDQCRLRDMLVQAYSPLRASVEHAPSLLAANPTDTSEAGRAARAVRSLATEKDVTPAAILIAWLLRHPGGIAPVIGSTNPDNIAGNCAADRVELSREEWYALVNEIVAASS